MNSMQDLNNYSNTSVPHGDQRPAQVVFSSELSSITLFPYENTPFAATPAVDIVSVTSLPQPITFAINLQVLPTATISWGNLTALGTGNLTVTTAANIYTVTGIQNASDWQIVRAPTITMPVNPPDDWTYTSTITYNNGNTRVWTSLVNVIQLDELSTPSDAYYSGDSEPPALLNYTPNLVNLGVGNIYTATYTLTVTPSNVSVMGNLTSSGIGATSSFNNSTKILTVTGNATGINNHLDNLNYYFTANLNVDWDAYYSLYNPIANFYSNVTQTIKSLDSAYLSRPSAEYYDANVVDLMVNYANISPTIAGASSTNTLKITGIPTSAVANISTVGTLGGTSSYAANVLTITGTVAQINNRLGNITLTTSVDYASDFKLQYQLITSDNITVSRLQDILISNALGVSNTNVNRYFVQNTSDQILFPNLIPQITETVSSSDTYTLILTSTIGKFGVSNSSVTATYSYTGTKAQVNSTIPNIKFYPNKDVTGAQIFNMHILRNGTVTRVDQNVGLIGSDRTLPISGSGSVYVIDTLSTQTLNFTYEQANYLTANILLVGGGGGAGGTIMTTYRSDTGTWPPTGLTTYTGYTGANPQWTTGSGGGGGGVRILSNIVVGSNAIATVGAGGAGGIGLIAFSNNPLPGNGTAGGATSLVIAGTTYSASGGAGGIGYNFYDTTGGTRTFSGGITGASSGSPTAYSGNNPPQPAPMSSPYLGQYLPTYPFWSGGGGGAGGAATNNYLGSYGAGTTTSIYSGTFGRGGSGRSGQAAGGYGEGGGGTDGGFLPTGVPALVGAKFKLYTSELAGGSGYPGLIVIKFN